MRRTAIAIAAAAIAAALALGGCGSDEAPDEQGRTADQTAPTTGAPEAETGDGTAVPELLDFTATTVGGEAFDGADLAGDPTVLWFWEHDCPVCQGQGDLVADLHETYGDQVDIVGVSGAGLYAASGDQERRDFVDRTGTGGIVHIEDADYALRTAFGVVSQSTFVVLDGEGTVVDSGPLGESDLTAAVDSLI